MNEELAKVSSGIHPLLLAPISPALGGSWSSFCTAHFLAADASPPVSPSLGILCFLENPWIDFPMDTVTVPSQVPLACPAADLQATGCSKPVRRV